MARARRVFSSEHPYHVTARCTNKEWFKLPIKFVWSSFCDQLHFVSRGYGAEIHSFVLMNNHFHLILSTPFANIDKVMWHLMSQVSRELTEASGRINQTFGGPYYSSLIASHHHFLHAYKYVYRNPVEAGLSKTVEGYKYSTLNGLLGSSHLLIPVVEDTVLFGDPPGTLRWLNEAYRENEKSDIKTALTKRQFTLPKNRDTRQRNRLETEMS